MNGSPQLELESIEEILFVEQHALSTNEHGEKMLVGLSVDESIWLVDWMRRRLRERLHPDEPRLGTREDRARYFELYDRHESARIQVLGAIIQMNTQDPTKN